MSASIETITKMMEPLPEPVQESIVEQVRHYIEDIQDEIQWNYLFKKKEDKLVEAARRARREIAEGLAEPMDYDRL